MNNLNTNSVAGSREYTVVLSFPKFFRDAFDQVPCWVGFGSGDGPMNAAAEVQKAAAAAYPEVRGPESFPVMFVFEGRHYDQVRCNPFRCSEGPSGEAFTDC